MAGTENQKKVEISKGNVKLLGNIKKLTVLIGKSAKYTIFFNSNISIEAQSLK